MNAIYVIKPNSVQAVPNSSGCWMLKITLKVNCFNKIL